MNEIIFYLFALLTILSAFAVAIVKNVLYAAFGLMFTFISLAVLYLYVGADFVAITQIMVYVGGVLVLIVFGIMLTSSVQNNETALFGRKLLGAVVSLLFLVIIVSGFLKVDFASLEWINQHLRLGHTQAVTSQHVGFNLLTTNLLPFELAAILLMVALIGAALMAKFKNSEDVEK